VQLTWKADSAWWEGPTGTSVTFDKPTSSRDKKNLKTKPVGSISCRSSPPSFAVGPLLVSHSCLKELAVRVHFDSSTEVTVNMRPAVP
jgi:hypothetical protein